MMQTKKTEESTSATESHCKGAAGVDKRIHFTPDMRFVVVRNQRNPWLDEHYEVPPHEANLPVFN